LFFEFRMDALFVGRSYTFEFLVTDRGSDVVYPAKNVRFRIK
jgi:hypothetical protein